MKTVTLTEAEARRVYEYLGGPCPLDRLEQSMADKIAREIGLPPYPKRPVARRHYAGDPLRGSLTLRGRLTDKVSEALHGID